MIGPISGYYTGEFIFRLFKRSKRSAGEPGTDIEWDVWYEDLFDRDCDPRIDVRGKGLVKGLMELWARYMFEAVGSKGERGFSRFHLTYNKEPGSIQINDNKEGAKTLRTWLFNNKRHCERGYVGEADSELLKIIALTHAKIAGSENASGQIFHIATISKTRDAFIHGLEELQGRTEMAEDPGS